MMEKIAAANVGKVKSKTFRATLTATMFRSLRSIKCGVIDKWNKCFSTYLAHVSVHWLVVVVTTFNLVQVFPLGQRKNLNYLSTCEHCPVAMTADGVEGSVG